EYGCRQPGVAPSALFCRSCRGATFRSRGAAVAFGTASTIATDPQARGYRWAPAAGADVTCGPPDECGRNLSRACAPDAAIGAGGFGRNPQRGSRRSRVLAGGIYRIVHAHWGPHAARTVPAAVSQGESAPARIVHLGRDGGDSER